MEKNPNENQQKKGHDGDTTPRNGVGAGPKDVVTERVSKYRKKQCKCNTTLKF